jgi:hypothetical protein
MRPVRGRERRRGRPAGVTGPGEGEEEANWERRKHSEKDECRGVDKVDGRRG